MSPLDVADNKVADPHDGTVAYVPPLERTAGQPEPIAAHGGLSYMAFDRDGDAGTAVALDDALAEIASGESQRLTDMLDKAPPGPIKTKWGVAFRSYDECLEYIRHGGTPALENWLPYAGANASAEDTVAYPSAPTERYPPAVLSA